MKPTSPSLARILSLPLFLAASASPVFAADWPSWRGDVAGSGITQETNLPTNWSATENVRWKVELPDRGNSTPIVWGDKVFLTQEVGSENKRTVLCLDRANGKTLWQAGPTWTEKEETHKTNPYCSASPVTDGERVIAWFGSAGVFCYDMNGKELWKRDLGRQDHEWGYAASPVIHKNLCFINFGPGSRSFLVALDKKTGKTVWQVDIPPVEGKGRTDGFAGKGGTTGSWSTPIVVKAGGRDELVVSLPEKLVAYDPATGKELWSCGGLNPLLYTSAIAGEGVVVAMGGFGGESVAVKAGGNGDVTAARLWHKVRDKQRIGSGVIKDGHIYIQNTPGPAQCIDLKTGETVWEERLQGPGRASQTWGSPILSGDKLYFLNQSADTFIVRASPKFEVIATNSIGQELTNSSPVPSNGELFIRTHKHLWCIGAKSKTAAR